MNLASVFLDTAFVQALLNARDQYYRQAIAFAPALRQATAVWTTEAVLLEIGNALSASNRTGAATFIRGCYHTPNIHVVTVDTALLERALVLFDSHRDKTWRLTDCISFVVMTEQGLIDALTADKHFQQAEFRALLLVEKS